jgi:ABC-type dipeptide/oligopeptide/nickel transport system permease subunit
MSSATATTMDVVPAAPKPQEHLSPNQQAWRRFRRNHAAVASGIFVLVLVAIVLIWPLWRTPRLITIMPRAMTYSPIALSNEPFSAPSDKYWFGTDANGRDILSRVFYGARISLLVGIVGASVSLVIGVLWGATAGYYGGRLDDRMMRFVDILYALPAIILVIVIITTLETYFKNWLAKMFSPDVATRGRMIFLFVGLGSVSWLTMARIVRGQVLSLRSRQFVHASRSLGAGGTRIMFRHILPNVLGVIIVYLMLIIPSIILYESFLSYLGLGIQPPQASLGSLIAEGAAQINPIRIYWWMIGFPAGLLAITLLALNFVGDGLRDALDPRTKG